MAHPTGITLRPIGGEPLYRQLFDQIVERIRTGTFPAGFRLPPTRELAKEVGAHRNTVVRTYEDLEAAGFVSSTVGRGTFVLEQPRALAVSPPLSRGPLPWASLVSNAVQAEPLLRSDRLGRSLAAADAVNLSRMAPSEDLLPVELMRRCLDHVMRTVGAKALSYTPREGLPRLRRLIAEDLVRQGLPAAADDIIVTTGSQQALDLVARVLVNPGDPFLVNEATYAGALNVLSVSGARIIGVPSDAEGPDLSVLARHARSGAKGMYLMPDCQNPTAACISKRRREALVAWSHEVQIPLVEDDYATDLHLDGSPHLPALRTLDGEVIHIGTYSKKLLPGIRVGYLLAPRGLFGRLVQLKHAMDLGTSGLLQHALAEFLERGYLRAHLGAVLGEYRKRREALEDGLRRHLPANVRWIHPEAGLQLWLPLPASVDPEHLFLEAQRQGVLVSPGVLNAAGPTSPRGVRLTFCAEPPARLQEGARRLARALAVVDRRSRPGGAADGTRFEAV